MHSTLSAAGDEAEIMYATGFDNPVGMYVKWLTPGEGREALNLLLSEILILEFDHLTTAIINGETYRVEPLRELAQRGGSWLNTRLEHDPERYDLIRDDEQVHHQGKRLDLLRSAELTLRVALKGFEGQEEPPSWVERSRSVYPLLLEALDGQDIFQPVGN